MPKRIEVKSFDSEGNEKLVYVVSPSPAVTREAQMEYNRAFKDAIKSGALLKQKLQSVMEEQGVWDEKKQERYDAILASTMEKEAQLQTGGIKLSEAKKIALEMRELRIEFRELIAERNSMDSNTAEGQADNARFSYLGYACLVDEEGNRVFSNFDHYQQSESEPFVIQAARELAQNDETTLELASEIPNPSNLHQGRTPLTKHRGSLPAKIKWHKSLPLSEKHDDPVGNHT